MNDQVLIDALAAVVRDPATWDQGVWATKTDCGTAYCLAGHICNNAGYEFVFKDDRPRTRVIADAVRVNGARTSVGTAACELLGTDVYVYFDDDDDELDLFGVDNSLDDLFRIGADLADLDETVLRDKVYDQAGVPQP